MLPTKWSCRTKPQASDMLDPCPFWCAEHSPGSHVWKCLFTHVCDLRAKYTYRCVLKLLQFTTLAKKLCCQTPWGGPDTTQVRAESEERGGLATEQRPHFSRYPGSGHSVGVPVHRLCGKARTLKFT